MTTWELATVGSPADEDTVTTSNSNLSIVAIDTGGSCVWESSVTPPSGNMCIRLVDSRLRYDFTALTSGYSRFYFRCDGTIGALRYIAAVGVAGSATGRIRLETTETLSVTQNTTGTAFTDEAGQSGVLAANTWYRIEYHFDTTADTLTGRIYDAADVLLATGSRAYTASNPDGTEIGDITQAGSETFYYADFGFSDTDWLGPVSGVATAALGGLVATAAGTPTVLGVATATLGGLTATAVGTPTISGVATASLGALTATAAGLPTVSGVATATLGGLTSTAVGVPTVSGVAVADLGALTATATSIPAVSGAATATLGALIATAVGTPTVFGVATAALGGLTATATGTPSALGVATAALGSLIATAAGTPTTFGVAVALLGALTSTIAVASGIVTVVHAVGAPRGTHVGEPHSPLYATAPSALLVATPRSTP